MQKKLLTAAVASTLSAMGGAHADVEKSEVGDVLLVPYYTTESGNETYINVVNTTDEFKALKVRFREARGSEDSLDFHVYMSPEDVWTAALTQDSDGTPTLVTNNSSCTFGRVGRTADSSGAQVRTTYVDEISDELADAGVDYEGPAAEERIREGYVEIIEMATYADESGGTNSGNLGHWTKHVDGAPRDCGAVAALNTIANDGDGLTPGEDASNVEFTGPDGEERTLTATGFGNRSGGLFGSAAIINVDDATYLPTEVTVLDTLDNGTAPSIFFSQSPRSASELAGFTIDEGLKAVKGDLQYWDLPDLSTTDGSGDTGRVDAISDALAATHIVNEFLVDPALGAETDWVVTQPTKRFYVLGDDFFDGDGIAEGITGVGGSISDGAITGQDYFTSAYDYANAQSYRGEVIQIDAWDRNERKIQFASEPSEGFSPGLPEAPTTAVLPYETTVFSFLRSESTTVNGPTPVLGAQVSTSGIAVGEDTRDGWASINLTEGGNDNGLPVIGFAAWQFFNDGQTATGSLNQYGGAFSHRFLQQPENGEGNND